MRNADAKRTRIIESAKKRFAHFGMAKTTMAEIAKDLSFSKALLYYYFPDKNRLYAAVLEFMMEEWVSSIDHVIEGHNDVEKTMLILLDERMRFLKEHYNILEYTYSLRYDMPSELQAILPQVFEKEKSQIKRALVKGVDSGELAIDDLDEVSKILLVAILGARLGQMEEFKSVFLPPTKEEFDQILAVQKKLVKIFINGLRIR